MRFSFVATRKYWYTFSGIYIALAIIAMFVWGFKPGIDFTGGALLEVKYEGTRPNPTQVHELLTPMQLGQIVVQPVDEANMLLRLPFISQQQHDEVFKKLDELNGEAGISEIRYETIGPSISKELRKNAITGIIVVMLLTILYIAFVFRKVGKPVSSWIFGLTLVGKALLHDVALPAGIMAVFGYYMGYEIDTLFVVALLTILGFSVNDTIATFDRIRETLTRAPKATFAETVDDSIYQTLARSINTSVTIILAMLAVYLFGGETIKNFMLMLIIGMVASAYSSVFIAAPLLVDFARLAAVRKK